MADSWILTVFSAVGVPTLDNHLNQSPGDEESRVIGSELSRETKGY